MQRKYYTSPLKYTQIDPMYGRFYCLNAYAFSTIGLAGIDCWTDGRTEKGDMIPELQKIP